MINKQIKQKACSFGDNRGKKIEKSKWKLLISLSPVSLNNSQRMFSFGCKWWRCCFLTRTQWLLHINPCMQGRYHEFEGGWSMHWKVVGGGDIALSKNKLNTKTLKFEKRGGAWPSPSSYGGSARACVQMLHFNRTVIIFHRDACLVVSAKTRSVGSVACMWSQWSGSSEKETFGFYSTATWAR